MTRSGLHRLASELLAILFLFCSLTFVFNESSSRIDPRPALPQFQDGNKPHPMSSPYLENFSLSAAFLAGLQDASGGIMEAEDNAYNNTDNTLEAIWVWCRYYRLTGDNRYFYNVWNAWNYSVENKAWLESDSGKIYSSAWALVAEKEFRQAYDNWSYNSYANASASFMITNDGREPDFWWKPLQRKYIKGWAAGTLYDWALSMDNDSAKQAAVNFGSDLMAAVENNVSILSNESWALSGGATFWGITHSVMQAYPNRTWVEIYAPYLKTEVMEPGTGPGNSQNGWEAWYALGYYGAFNVTSNQSFYGIYQNITDRLIDRDGDRDGGIPTNVGDPDNTDESWVTSYRAYFCLRQKMKVIPRISPGEVVLRSVDITGKNGENVTIAWNLSVDDLGGQRDVVAYEIYFSESYDSNHFGYVLLGSVRNGTSNFTHAGAGKDARTYFYYVLVRDSQNLTSCSRQQGFKFGLTLSAGVQLISIPLVRISSVTEVLSSLPTGEIHSYDAWDPNHWKSFHPAKYENDLLSIDRSMALWTNLSAPGVLKTAGIVYNSTVIHLRKGWNFVSFPSFESNYTIGEFRSETGALRVEGYDPTNRPFFLRIMGDDEMMTAGNGYWVQVTQNVDWLIQN